MILQRMRRLPRPAMKMPTLFSSLFVAAAVMLTGCNSKKAPPAVGSPQVVVAVVEPRDVSITREWIGRLDGSANVDVRARVQGYIDEIAFKEGTVVKEGDLLLRIDPRELEAALAQAKAELAQATAVRRKAEIDEQRQQQLFDKKITSKEDYDNAVQANLAAQAAAASAQAALDKAELNLAFATISSPINGIVGRTDFNVGDFVAAGSGGTPVTTVSTVDPIKLVFSVSEKDYLEAADRITTILGKPLDQREATGELIRADGKVHPYKGRFLAADREVDAKTGTIRISAIFPNPGNILRPGQYAKVRINVEKRPGVIIIAQRAVQELQGKNFVWVVDDANKVSQRQVTVGSRFGSDWIIEDGLKPGEHIVVEGLQKVREGALVQPSRAAPTPPVTAAANLTKE
jgi:membrane fusion protein (multidrug efflux system)